MSGSTYGVAEVIDGVQIYYSEDVMAQGLYYPENSREDDARLPFAVLPLGADPVPAVAKVKARMAREAAPEVAA